MSGSARSRGSRSTRLLRTPGSPATSSTSKCPGGSSTTSRRHWTPSPGWRWRRSRMSPARTPGARSRPLAWPACSSEPGGWTTWGRPSRPRRPSGGCATGWACRRRPWCTWGDRYGADALGAVEAGLTGVWLDRPGAEPDGRAPQGDPDPRVQVISSLAQLPALARPLPLSGSGRAIRRPHPDNSVWVWVNGDRTGILDAVRARPAPMGYGVIGSPADSGSASLGSSPGTPAMKVAYDYVDSRSLYRSTGAAPFGPVV